MTQSPGKESSPLPASAEVDEHAEFAEVLSVLDKEQLSLLGSTTLRRLQPQLAPSDTEPTVGEPMYGSYHVLFPLDFNTGLRWLVKIPINGTASKWDEMSALPLASEAKTMQLLKRETSIPLSNVLEFSSTTQNCLRCPYIILSFVSGVPLYDVWFGHRLKGDNLQVTRARRTRALEGIAFAMMQLGKFPFRTSGSPVFGSNGTLLRTGPMRRVNQKAMLDRWFIHQDPAEDPLYASYPVSSDSKAYYTFMLDMYPEQKSFSKGLAMLLYQLISWIPEPSGMDHFVLAHPDFDIQNFIVSEDGDLRGIIDWDGVAALPRTIGNERYPGWLTRDWDPAMYGYEESMEQGLEPGGVWEDSPNCLAQYRNVYRNFIADYQRDDSSVGFCRLSLITDNLTIAADDPRCRNGILRKIAQEIWSRAGQGSEPDFEALVTAFAENSVDAAVMNTLQVGFNALLTEEGL
ncbi:hypothetical protein GGR54DRAFT_629978 [Hypoxylon sp. NC1633]|nr:hypothetical protein GGR54DRAFT_629978 [Hypoxylon sp. NC1633]